jgi:hypothetical protein
MSQLDQFLADKKAQLDPNRRPQEIIDEWRSAVSRMEDNIARVLAPYSRDLKVKDW